MGYQERIDGYREEMLDRLRDFIRIPSVVGPAEGDMPFGKGVHDAFMFMLKLGEEAGFDTCDIDHYGGHLDYVPGPSADEGENGDARVETLGILGHVDVVPEGSGWDHPPYGGEIADGRLYGRGALDDKGPVMAAFYALKALKDEGFIPKKRIRLILGLDEETDWVGMEKYLAKVPAPDFSFTPDADFPVIHGEMGFLIFELAKKFAPSHNVKGISLRSVSGGTAANSVADSAKAIIHAADYDEIKAKLADFRERTGYKIGAKGRGKSLEIAAEGVAAHGATPWKGVNAISVLMQFLRELGVASEDMKDFIRFYCDKIGMEVDGESLGCGFSDEISGKLVLNVGMIHLDEEAARLTVNVRYPISCTDEQVYEAMMPLLNEYEMGIVKLNHQAPIYTPMDSHLVRVLTDVYRRHTGDRETQPLVIGGGTYARAVPNAVAYGPIFPGEPEVQHQKNEYIDVERLLQITKIYADAIYELTK